MYIVYISTSSICNRLYFAKNFNMFENCLNIFEQQFTCIQRKKKRSRALNYIKNFLQFCFQNTCKNLTFSNSKTKQKSSKKYLGIRTRTYKKMCVLFFLF